MTGGSVGDLLAPEDVVSLLLDDVQLEQKLKEIPLQVSCESGYSNLVKNYSMSNIFDLQYKL